MPTMDVHTRLRELAAREFSIDPDTLDPASELKSLKIDSLAYLEFTFKVEEAFGISLDEEEVKAVRTIADLERCVENAVNVASKA
jgi:acyl carrier protein